MTAVTPLSESTTPPPGGLDSILRRMKEGETDGVEILCMVAKADDNIKLDLYGACRDGVSCPNGSIHLEKCEARSGKSYSHDEDD